jgi:hypothetical protein
MRSRSAGAQFASRSRGPQRSRLWIAAVGRTPVHSISPTLIQGILTKKLEEQPSAITGHQSSANALAPQRLRDERRFWAQEENWRVIPKPAGRRILRFRFQSLHFTADYQIDSSYLLNGFVRSPGTRCGEWQGARRVCEHACGLKQTTTVLRNSAETSPHLWRFALFPRARQ